MSYLNYLGNDTAIPEGELREVYRELAAFLNQNVDKQRDPAHKKLMDRVLVQAYKSDGKGGLSIAPEVSLGMHSSDFPAPIQPFPSDPITSRLNKPLLDVSPTPAPNGRPSSEFPVSSQPFPSKSHTSGLSVNDPLNATDTTHAKRKRTVPKTKAETVTVANNASSSFL